MLNLYESVRTIPTFNRLNIGELLFAEYTCPIGLEKVGVWAHTDYLVHVISGKKTWHTDDGAWPADAGDTLFFKKGASIVQQHFEVDFCVLMFFVPDQLIRETVRELVGELPAPATHGGRCKSTMRVTNNTALEAFFQSMLAYFGGKDKPSEALVQLKLKELVISVLTSAENSELANYFRSSAAQEGPSLDEVMEANYRYNLSLEEYAELSHRSLSSFKRDFRKVYDETPGKWLLHKRLSHAAALLRAGQMNVTEVVFESGFEDVSHFSRVFKARYEVTPSGFSKAEAGRS